MNKLNNKGYMLVEIILAFAITFGLIYFLMDLVINLKNKNDDLLVDTIIKTDQTIISNKLMDYIIVDTSDESNIEFKCENITVDKQAIMYNGNVLGVVDDSATISYNPSVNCSNVNGKIHINIPVEIRQMSDKNYDIVVDYRYKLKECNLPKSYQCANANVGSEPYFFTYDGGNCKVEYDEDLCNWKIKFLTTGTLIVNSNMVIDAFLVGGGGSGSFAGHGGGGGYTTTKKKYEIISGKPYSIVIGDGGKGTKVNDGSEISGSNGGTTSAFEVTALGGETGGYYLKPYGIGGAGGSGGGSGTDPYNYPNPSIPSYAPAPGGVDGGNGGNSDIPGGTGQGTTTREFGETTGKLYATGGDGFFMKIGKIKDGIDNTGDGGSGGGSPYPVGDDYSQIKVSGNGGSGIVVIRNHIELEPTNKIENSNVKFGYNGQYETVEGNGDNWKIKFLNDGEFIVDRDIEVDIFLVGGGGGGSSFGNYYRTNGGGGGYTTTVKGITIKAGQIYKIDVGSGGAVGGDGKPSIVFYKDAEGEEKVLEKINEVDGEIVRVEAGGGFAGTAVGGAGGSGGGSGNNDGYSLVSGGVNGGSGGNFGGEGQKTTTREFGETTGDLYASGGDGVSWYNGITVNGDANTGNGGSGGGGGGGSESYCNREVAKCYSENGDCNVALYCAAGIGGSGIVIIRNSR